MKKILLALLLVPAISWAGIRVIYGGGGYAEMQALSALSQLNVLVELAGFRGGNGPIARHAYTLRLWNHNRLFDMRNAELHFTDADPNPKSRDQVFLPLPLIYDEAGQPRPTSEITKQVFIAWMSRPWVATLLRNSGTSEADVRAIAEALFEGLEVKQQSLDGLEWRLHSVEWYEAASNWKEVWLSLEGPVETFDLRLGLSLALPCPADAVGPVTLTEVQGLHLDGDRVLGRVKWKCWRDREFSARMVIHPSLVYDRTEFQISQVESLEKPTCAELLGRTSP